MRVVATCGAWKRRGPRSARPCFADQPLRLPVPHDVLVTPFFFATTALHNVPSDIPVLFLCARFNNVTCHVAKAIGICRGRPARTRRTIPPAVSVSLPVSPNLRWARYAPPFLSSPFSFSSENQHTSGHGSAAHRRCGVRRRGIVVVRNSRILVYFFSVREKARRDN